MSRPDDPRDETPPPSRDEASDPASAEEVRGEAAPDHPGSRCHNCGAVLHGEFCHDCGQREQDLDVRFGHLAGDWLGSVLGLDARIWRTLRILFGRPGALTTEFLDGRRARYVTPLRLYLVSSVLMLLSLSWSGYEVIGNGRDSGGRTGIVHFDLDDGAEAGTEAGTEGEDEDRAGQASEGEARDPAREAAEEDGEPGAEGDPEQDEDDFGKQLEDLFRSIDSDRQGFERSFREYLPQALFLLVPVFAFQLWLLFRRRYRRYLHHLIFSLHTHAAVFFAIAVVSPFDTLLGLESITLGDLVAVGFLGYLFLALRRMYGEGRWWTACKMGGLLFVHSLMLAFALLLAAVLAALRLHGSI